MQAYEGWFSGSYSVRSRQGEMLPLRFLIWEHRPWIPEPVDKSRDEERSLRRHGISLEVGCEFQLERVRFSRLEDVKGMVRDLSETAVQNRGQNTRV